MIKGLSLLATIIIHTIIVVILFWTPKQLIEKPSGAEDVQYIVAEPTLLESSVNGISCPKTYRGIGVMINFGSLKVIQVVKGGPADKAGVQLEDIILDDYYNHHAKGTEVIITVIRNGKEMKLHAIIDDICYE